MPGTFVATTALLKAIASIMKVVAPSYREGRIKEAMHF